VPATARASFNVYTTPGDIDALIAGIGEVKRIFAD
jgi:selenocysteine lyase/cysteine desulfurase